MVRLKAKDKLIQRKVAEERINILLNVSKELLKEGLVEEARNAVKTAVRLAKKHNIRLGKRKMEFCNKCFIPFTDETLTVRIVSYPQKKVVYKCKVCGYEKYIVYKNKLEKDLT